MNREKLNKTDFAKLALELEKKIGNILEDYPLHVCGASVEIILSYILLQLNFSGEELVIHLTRLAVKIEGLRRELNIQEKGKKDGTT